MITKKPMGSFYSICRVVGPQQMMVIGFWGLFFVYTTEIMNHSERPSLAFMKN